MVSLAFFLVFVMEPWVVEPYLVGKCWLMSEIWVAIWLAVECTVVEHMAGASVGQGIRFLNY